MRSEILPPPILSPAVAPESRLVAAATFLSLALLMAYPVAASVLLAVLTLAGMVVAIRAPGLHPSEMEFAGLCLTIPAAYLLNMAFTGWQASLLDRPMHLAYCIPLAMLVARRGLTMRTLVAATVAAALVTGGIALFEGVVAGQARVFGLGGRWNAVPFGNFSLLLGCAALAGGIAMAGNGASRSWLAAGLLGFAAGLYASMLSGTRGGWLALPFLVVIATHASRAVRLRHRMLMAGLLLALALASFATSDSVRHRVGEAIDNVAEFVAQPTSLESMANASGIRLAMWRWGLDRFREHPYSGIGYANFASYRHASVERGELPPHFDGLSNLHNELISSLACGGLPSAALLVAFWVLGLRFFGRRLKGSTDPAIRYFATVGLLTIVGTAIFSMTEGLFGTRPGTYALAVLLALPAGALCRAEMQGRA